MNSRAIVLTPLQPAAIAVVRLVGPATRVFVEKHLDRQPVAGKTVHTKLRDGETVLDDPVITALEDGVDLCLHGNPWIVQRLIGLARDIGFEIGEDPTDGATLLEREILQAIPLARTELATAALLSQERAWESTSVIDESILQDRALHWLLNPPIVAIVGAPNVGKSTLANQLFAQQRSITADVPGTTRDWVGEIANLDGLAVMLVDTPGARTTCDPIESAAIEQSRPVIEKADLVVRVFDAGEVSGDGILVMNKIDLLPRKTLGAIGTVATTGRGVDDLRRAIRRFFGCDELDLSRPRCWNDRQRQCVQSGKHPFQAP